MDNSKLRSAQLVMLKILDEVKRICEKNQIEYWLDSGTLLGAVRHKGFIPWDDDLDICMMRDDYNRFIEVCKDELDSKYFLQIYDTDKYTQNPFLKIRDRNSILRMNEREKGHVGIFVDIFPMDPYDSKDNNNTNYKIKKSLNNKILFYWMKYAEIKKPFLKNLKGNLVKVMARTYFYIFHNYDYESLNIEAKKYVNKINMENIKTSKYVGYGVEVPFEQILKREDVFPLTTLEFEGKKYYTPGNFDGYLKEFYGDYMKLPDIEDRVPSHCIELKVKLTPEEYEKLNSRY
ncbi:phosphorylcholine transferase LicD [Clostridium sp.]|uniref:phosphorylcholine transferase LicD n=1 Tax=Clostridium sp. TaxID=1506 RepID=UPI00346473CC